jgi:hypothetical protein
MMLQHPVCDKSPYLVHTPEAKTAAIARMNRGEPYMRKTEIGMSAELAVPRLFLILMVTFASLAANAADGPKPVFVKATCLGKVSSSVLSFFREEMRRSQKYQLVPNLSDNGLMDLVLTIDMNCTESNDVAAVATVYGNAKCFSSTNCHVTIVGSSIRSVLCESKAVTECGRILFKAFDDYMSNPIAPRLKLN